MSAQEVRADQKTPRGHQQEAAGLCSGMNSHVTVSALNMETQVFFNFVFRLLLIFRNMTSKVKN